MGGGPLGGSALMKNEIEAARKYARRPGMAVAGSSERNAPSIWDRALTPEKVSDLRLKSLGLPSPRPKTRRRP